MGDGDNFSRLVKWFKQYNESRGSGNFIIVIAPIHPKDFELSNIELFFFQPNTSSLIQPLDQGIIKIFKDYYKNLFWASQWILI